MATLLARLDPAQTSVRGVMSPQHMVEHLTDGVRLSNGQEPTGLASPDNNYQLLLGFLLSDLSLGCAPNPRAQPVPLRSASLAGSCARLVHELDIFYAFHQQPLAGCPVHPVFGPLGFSKWELFHFKHSDYHLLQFELLRGQPFPPLHTPLFHVLYFLSMKLETKRLLLFGVLITMTTSLYVTFLGTWLTYGIRPGFLSQWLRNVPRAYLVVLPYILLVGPLVQRLVHRLLPASPVPHQPPHEAPSQQAKPAS